MPLDGRCRAADQTNTFIAVRDGGRTARFSRVSMSVMIIFGLVAGCGVPGRSSGSADGTPHVWVGSSSDSAVLVQLTRQDSSLTGTIDESSAEDDAPTVKPTHLQFTGTVSGTALTL